MESVECFLSFAEVHPLNSLAMMTILILCRTEWTTVLLSQKLDADSGRRKSPFRYSSPEAATSPGETECGR